MQPGSLVHDELRDLTCVKLLQGEQYATCSTTGRHGACSASWPLRVTSPSPARLQEARAAHVHDGWQADGDGAGEEQHRAPPQAPPERCLANICRGGEGESRQGAAYACQEPAWMQQHSKHPLEGAISSGQMEPLCLGRHGMLWHSRQAMAVRTLPALQRSPASDILPCLSLCRYRRYRMAAEKTENSVMNSRSLRAGLKPRNVKQKGSQPCKGGAEGGAG